MQALLDGSVRCGDRVAIDDLHRVAYAPAINLRKELHYAHH